MKNKIVCTVMIALLGVGGTAAMADVGKGQKLYSKKLKKKCGFTGAKMAGMHEQMEWEEIYEEGKLLEEIQRICPNVKGLNDKYLPHLYDFFYEYGSDSGNVPAC